MVRDHPPVTQDDRPVGELVAGLAQQAATLMRQEWLLARTELAQSARRLGKDVGILLLGGAVAYAGFLALLAFIIIGLATLGLPWWLAALIVAVVVTGAGVVLVQRGLTSLQGEDLTPRQTMETLRDDLRLVKEETR